MSTIDMQDRELLRLAAKALGAPSPYDANGVFGAWIGEVETGHWWNPLEDDGDAFRLMLALQVDVSFWRDDDSVCVSIHGNLSATAVGSIGDIELRRAIVRAAAEIGRSMPC